MIEDFALSSKALYSILKEKNVQFLYHANTVATSLTFIKSGCLLSRHQVEIDGLTQSYQKSDEHDKKHDVWDHIYVDGTDHHKIYGQSNFYGPVLFRLDLKLLVSPSFQEIYVMKSNPMFWNDKMSLDDKFYQNIDEIAADYLTKKKNDAQIMFTFRNPGHNLKFNKFLHSIGIDEPSIPIKLRTGAEIPAGDFVRTTIESALKDNNLSHIPVLKRHEKGLEWCKCEAQYTFMYNFNLKEFKRRFSITPQPA